MKLLLLHPLPLDGSIFSTDLRSLGDECLAPSMHERTAQTSLQRGPDRWRSSVASTTSGLSGAAASLTCCPTGRSISSVASAATCRYVPPDALTAITADVLASVV